MGAEQVAEVYARALFAAARERGVVEPARRDLGAFVSAMVASAQLRDVLADPQIDSSAKRRVVVEVGRDGEPLVANTLLLMLERGRFAAVADVRDEFERLAVAELDLVTVEVTSAVQLSDDAHRRITARVAAAVGRRVKVASRVDPHIIGGLVLRVGDVIVDGSVQARIRQLRRRLAAPEVRGGVQ